MFDLCIKLMLYTGAKRRGQWAGWYCAWGAVGITEPTSDYYSSQDLNQQPSGYKTSSIPLSLELQGFVFILEKMET